MATSVFATPVEAADFEEWQVPSAEGHQLDDLVFRLWQQGNGWEQTVDETLLEAEEALLCHGNWS
jgi:hypothetical protein